MKINLLLSLLLFSCNLIFSQNNDISGPDDFASMEQVVYRRLKRLVKEKNSLPD